MASFNRVLLIGNVTRDPEIRFTAKGSPVAEIGLAVNRVLRSDEGEHREETLFVSVTLWGRTAEIAEQYLHKSSSVFVEGRLQLDTWDDKQTGQKRLRLKVVGEGLQLLGSRPESGSKPAGVRPAARQTREPEPEVEPDDVPS